MVYPPPTTPDSASERRQDPLYPAGALAWAAVAVLTAAYTLSYMDRQILSLMVGPIRRDLHLSDTQISLLQGLAFAIFYSVLGLPLGRLADNTNRVRLISMGVAFWSLMTGLCGMAHNFAMLFLARLGVGAGEAVLSPAAYSLIHDFFPRRRVGLAMSVYALGIALGAALALVIGSQMVQAVQDKPPVIVPIIGEMFAWQFVFFYLGLPGIGLALMVLLIREPLRRGMKTQNDAPAMWIDLWRYLVDRRALVFYHFGGVSLLALIAYARGAWGPTFYMRTFGWSVGQAGAWLGGSGLVAGLSGVVFGGWYADRWVARGVEDAHMRIIAICAIGTPITLTLGYTCGSPWLSLVLITLGGVFMAAYGGVSAAAVQQTAPPRLRGQMSALLLMSQTVIGLVLGPLSVALLNDYVFKDPQAIRWSLAIVSLAIGPVAAVLLFRGLKPYRLALEAASA